MLQMTSVMMRGVEGGQLGLLVESRMTALMMESRMKGVGLLVVADKMI